MHTREPFEKAYKVYHVLGKGGFGIVYAGVRNHDGLQVAIKHIAKAKIKDWGQVSHFILFIFHSTTLNGFFKLLINLGNKLYSNEYIFYPLYFFMVFLVMTSATI